MRTFISLLFLLSGTVLTAAVVCKIPNEGPHLGRDKECVALVQNNCPNIGTTATWKRGLKVKDNCGTITRGTAIATFAGPNNSYNGGKYKHAAIFDKCVSNGIQVWDQYNKSNGVKNRVLTYGNSGNSNNGDNFYVIN